MRRINRRNFALVMGTLFATFTLAMGLVFAGDHKLQTIFWSLPLAGWMLLAVCERTTRRVPSAPPALEKLFAHIKS